MKDCYNCKHGYPSIKYALLAICKNENREKNIKLHHPISRRIGYVYNNVYGCYESGGFD